MTKAELIKFLEPFEDDIQICGEDNESGIYNVEAQYKIAGDYESRSNVGLEKGDGYIVI